MALIGKGLTFDSGGYNIKVCDLLYISSSKYPPRLKAE